MGHSITEVPKYFFAAHVDGVEVTQSIQYYRAHRHLTDSSDRGPTNSVRLIAGKEAWVRVYVRSNLIEQITGITGSLTVERKAKSMWHTATTLTPQASVTAHRNRDYATQRSTITDTLNFVIPDDEFFGDLKLTVQLQDQAGDNHGSHTLSVDATLRQTLRIRAIFVSYNGPPTATMPPPGSPPPPNLVLPAPTLAGLQTTASLALRAMPVESQGNFASAGTVAWNLPLDDGRTQNGGCSANWGALLGALGNQRTNDGNRSDVVYYGLLPAAIPRGNPTGCGNDGLGSAAVGDQATLFHEIGHGYGFQHTPCGPGGASDPNYPNYEPYASASIGEYGLDIADGTIWSPASTFDYMSYCFPQWMSLYQHDRLILHGRLGHSWARDDWAWWKWKKYLVEQDLPYPPNDVYGREKMRFDPVIAISGLVHGPGRVEVRNVARTTVNGFPAGPQTTLVARLVGADGGTLARATARRLSGKGCSACGEDGSDGRDENPDSYAFEVYVPDVDRGAALVIEDGEEAVWERQAPAEEPAVRELQATVAQDGQLELRWDSSVGRSEAGTSEVWVQTSVDGEIWRGLATGLTGDAATLPLAGIEPGPVLVRVLVHDGFSTALSEPVQVEVPQGAPLVAILHPEDGGVLRAGGPMRAWGSVTDQAGKPVPDADARWLLDGREVGQGLSAWLTAPDAGEHRMTVLVRAEGMEAESSVTFTCMADSAGGADQSSTVSPRR